MGRRPLRFLLALAATACAGPAHSQGYPNKAVRIVVPFAAGGAVDTVARILAAKLPETLGQSVIVDNRTGAGGNIGADAVAKSAPDGYTLLFTTSGHAISPSLYRTLPYDTVKHFTPVTQVLATTLILVASPKLAAASIAEVIALAKAMPGRLNYGSSGFGAPLHLAMETLKHSAGVDIVHVPYRGDAPLYAALVAGDIQLAILPATTGMPQVRSGVIRALGVVGPKRSPALPDVPTISEAGVAGLESRSWNGLFAPAGTPREAIVTVQQHVARALAAPAVRERILDMGQEPVGSTPEEFDALFKAEIVKFAKIIADAKIPKQE